MPAITHTRKENSSILVSSRIRLARNLKGKKFSPYANSRQLADIYKTCFDALSKVKRLKDAKRYDMQAIGPREREFLTESRAISKEMDIRTLGKGAFVVEEAHTSVFINEEDHIRIQVIGKSLPLLYKSASALDNEIEKELEYAFSQDIGYITSCPTNMGTGMRASVMLHLPALSMTNDIEKIVRAVNQLGMVIRGSNGEGSDSVNSFFQLSNQQTLGVSEADIIKKIQTFCKKICQFESDARYKMLEDRPLVLVDKVLRARSILQTCKLIDSQEALSLLSIMRLAADMNMMDFCGEALERIDELSLEVLPAHLCRAFGAEDAQGALRDELRARLLNEEIAKLPKLSIKGV